MNFESLNLEQGRLSERPGGLGILEDPVIFLFKFLESDSQGIWSKKARGSLYSERSVDPYISKRSVDPYVSNRSVNPYISKQSVDPYISKWSVDPCILNGP